MTRLTTMIASAATPGARLTRDLASSGPLPTSSSSQSSLGALALSARSTGYRYLRRVNAPADFSSERLPPLASDFESRLVDFGDFINRIIASRDRSRAQIKRKAVDVFDDQRISEDDVDL